MLRKITCFCIVAHLLLEVLGVQDAAQTDVDLRLLLTFRLHIASRYHIRNSLLVNYFLNLM